jgi:hypothetical protein
MSKDLTETELKRLEEDANLQFIVLLTLIIQKIEFLEERKYIYGTIKVFLKNSKTKYEDFINKVFSFQEKVEGNDAKQATSKLLVMLERTELALENQYILTVDERRRRARKILKTMFLEQYKVMGLHKSMTPQLLNQMRRNAVIESMTQMKHQNLFNF